MQSGEIRNEQVLRVNISLTLILAMPCLPPHGTGVGAGTNPREAKPNTRRHNLADFTIFYGHFNNGMLMLYIA